MIRTNGPIPFRDFMARALYDPEEGYYGSGRAVIGRRGDFFTNVSVGPLFGTLLARQFIEMWHRLGEPSPFTIVEQGAHDGTLCNDVLNALAFLAPEMFTRTQYWFVEPSARLRQAQQETVRAYHDKVEWGQKLEHLPPVIGVQLSNELLDAFPVHLIRWSGNNWEERYVAFDETRLVLQDRPVSSPALATYVDRLPKDLPVGYQTEVNLAALDWCGDVTNHLERGYILLIDYGYPHSIYYAPERTEGTLTGYSKHRREPDPLSRPGEIDLTAHIDFTNIAEAFEQAGAQLVGFADQHHFMVGLSRLHFSDTNELSAELSKELRAFQTLMHPGIMGLSFSAMCAAKNQTDPQPLAGFQFAGDPRAKLGL